MSENTGKNTGKTGGKRSATNRREQQARTRSCSQERTGSGSASERPAISMRAETFYECDAAGEEVVGAGEGRRVLYVSIPIRVRHHRGRPGPETLEVGQVSPGSLDLALNILSYLYPPACDGEPPVRCRVNLASATAYRLHKRFCSRFLARMDPEGGEIEPEKIRRWVEAQARCTSG